MKTLSISTVDGRPERIEIYVFWNENALVQTGPKSKSAI